jgi:polyhydroxyalkanoate synthesis regulator phasin
MTNFAAKKRIREILEEIENILRTTREGAAQNVRVRILKNELQSLRNQIHN